MSITSIIDILRIYIFELKRFSQYTLHTLYITIYLHICIPSAQSRCTISGPSPHFFFVPPFLPIYLSLYIQAAEWTLFRKLAVDRDNEAETNFCFLSNRIHCCLQLYLWVIWIQYIMYVDCRYIYCAYYYTLESYFSWSQMLIWLKRGAHSIKKKEKTRKRRGGAEKSVT